MPDLIRIVHATNGFGERLDAVGAMWSSVARTHREAKESSILVRGKRRRLALIGREPAGPADPRWDIGCVAALRLVSAAIESVRASHRPTSGPQRRFSPPSSMITSPVR